MRIYLVIVDESEEALVALQFAARRAAKTDGALHLLALVPPQPFNAFAGVQATIEEEARARAVHMGEDIKIVRKYLEEHPEVSALVLGAAKEGGPGALVAHFTGPGMAHMTCPVFVVPGGLDAEAIERLS